MKGQYEKLKREEPEKGRGKGHYEQMDSQNAQSKERKTILRLSMITVFVVFIKT